MGLLGGWEAEGLVVAVEGDAEGFDDEVVVFALGEAGDGDAADDSGAGDGDGEGAAVGGVVGGRERVFFGEGGLVEQEVKAESVGTAMEAGDDVDLALDPAGVVGRGAGEGGVEKLLVGLAEAANVDDDGVIAIGGELAKGEAEGPGGIVVEGGEEEFFFLLRDGCDVVGDGQGETPEGGCYEAGLAGPGEMYSRDKELIPFYQRSPAYVFLA